MRFRVDPGCHRSYSTVTLEPGPGFLKDDTKGSKNKSSLIPFLKSETNPSYNPGKRNSPLLFNKLTDIRSLVVFRVCKNFYFKVYWGYILFFSFFSRLYL